jgi:Fic family protein
MIAPIDRGRRVRSFPDNYLESLSLTPAHGATLRAIGEYRGKQALFFQQAPEMLKTLRESAKIESTESSSRIEGVTVVPARLQSLMNRSTDPRNRLEQEISGYRDALALIHESAHELKFLPRIVRQIHSTLYRYMAEEGGGWKTGQNEITETNADRNQRVRFASSPPHLVPRQMDALCKRYGRASAGQRWDGLLLVPLAVLDFLCIHPFPDGNGRVARRLSLMLLYQYGYEVGRYISLERIIEDSKETYYEALEASSQGWHEGEHDVAPWLEYFWGVLLRGYREFEEQVHVVREGHGAKTEQVRLAVLRRQ